MNVTYLTYKHIDKEKWDACIKWSVNGLIYAESVYLDRMAAHWDAVVLDDYAAVMPLTWRKKLGIRYLYQPAFLQQGGVFFKEPLSKETIKAFMDEVFRQFKFAEITFNYSNNIEELKKVLMISLRNNYILQLGYGYDTLYKNYDLYIKQRLNRLSKFLLRYTVSDDYRGALAAYKQLYQDRLPAVSKEDYQHFEKLCEHYAAKGRLVIRHVYKQGENKLLALVLLLKDDRRLYNIISCIMPEGKKLLANYFLYNAVIREFANENITLDFEGSDVSGIAYFYEKFAGENQSYPFVKFNNLPFVVRLLKR